MLRRHLVVMMIVVCSYTPQLAAQAHRAIVLGQITDSSGAVVPGVEIRVIQRDTNVARTTQSNSAGNYEVPGLLPGTYVVTAERGGFRKESVENVTVASGSQVQVNLVLQPGQLSESVTVSAQREILDSTSADVNSITDQRKITDLPIGQGNATYMAVMASGTSTANSLNIGSSTGNDASPMQRAGTQLMRFDGAPSGTAEFAIDGAPNMQQGNGGAGGGASYNPSPDVVQEVRVQTATFDASIGHTGGATIDLVLRSGTNEYHGSAYSFFRDTTWNANSWSGNTGGIPRPNFTYQLWGFSGGGPITIPKIYNGRNRTFFFAGYEYWSSLSPDSPVIVSVPTSQEIKGDLSDLLKLGQQYQIYDPASAQAAANGLVQRSPFAGNIIPSSRISPVSAAYAALWPSPNTRGTADNQSNFSYLQEPFPRTYWALPVRVDHSLTDRLKFFGRVVASNTVIPSNSLFGLSSVSVMGDTGNHREAATGAIWTISPTFIADVRSSIMRFDWEVVPMGTNLDPSHYGIDYLNNYYDVQAGGIPSMSIAGLQAFTNAQGSRTISEIRSTGVYFTKILRNHSLKFGGDARWYIASIGKTDQLSISFTGANSNGPLSSSPAPPVGAGLSDFLLGVFSSATLNQPVQASNLSTYQGLYFQDDWKVTKRLTVSLGMRYEREGPPTERYNRSLADFNFTVQNPIASQARANYAASPIPELSVGNFNVIGGTIFAGIGGAPRTAYNLDANNFAPRAAIAYQLGRDTVIRAGYGVFFVPNGQRFYASNGTVPGYGASTITQSSLNGGLTFPNTLANLFAAGLSPATGSAAGLATSLGQSIALQTLRNNPNAYTQRYLFSVQHRLGANRFEARYVGSRTIKIPISQNLDALPDAYLSTSPVRDQATINSLTRSISNPFYKIPGVTGTIGTAATTTPSALLRPYAEFAGITAFDAQGWSNYQALQTEFERQLAHGVTFQMGYTFSKNIEAVSYLNAGDGVPASAIATTDRPSIWRFLGIWELPFGKGRRYLSSMRALPERLLGGWQLQWISTYQSGAPVTWGNVLFQGNIKDIGLSDPSPNEVFNTSAGFVKNAQQQLADNLRTFPLQLAGVRLPGEWNTDFSLIKNTRIAERFSAQFRAEAYNVLNQHFVSGNPNTDPTSGAFGTSTLVSGPRELQLGVRLTF